MQTSTSSSLTERILSSLRHALSTDRSRAEFAIVSSKTGSQPDLEELSPSQIEEKERQQKLLNPTYYLA